MRCPKCGHNVPNAKGKCNYCAAVTGTAESMDIPGMREDRSFSENVSKSVLAYSVTDVAQIYGNLNNVPDNLRRKFEEAMGKGRGEEREKDILLQFGLAKTKRKPKRNPLVLMLISLGSAILAGALVWFST
jgi:hypothetical protein